MLNIHARSIFALFCTLSVLLLCIVSAQAAEPILIRFSHVVSEDTPKGIGAKLFKEMVEKRLAGKVRVEIYPLSQKYSDDEQAILGLLFGDIEMVAPSFPKFYQFSKSLAIFDQPFFFNSVEEVHTFQDSARGKDLLLSMENRGILGLSYWDNGMRVISANTPIRVPADLKGLKIRIEPSNVIYNQYSLVEALPIPITFKQLPDALREGLVDGHENAWSNIYSRNLHLLRRHFTEINHSYLGYMVATSTLFWKGLPAEIRIELEKILAEVRVEVTRIAAEKVRTDREKVLASENIKLITLSEAEKQPWRIALLPIWKEFEATVGKEMVNSMEKAKAGK